MECLRSGVEGSHENASNVILVANGPRSYREAIAGVLREVCTGGEVLVAEPEDLDLEVGRVSPGVVVCSRATALVKQEVFAWIELYPNGGRLSVISIDRKRWKVREVQLDDLLSFVELGMAHIRAS